MAKEIPSNSAAIIDGMSLVQKVNADRLPFGDVAHTVLNMALREGSQCKRIDLVFDTYKEISIKTVSGIYGARKLGISWAASPTLR